MQPQAKSAKPGTINIVLNESKERTAPRQKGLVRNQPAAPFLKIDEFFSNIIGMDDLKSRVKEIYAQVLVSQKRVEAGLKGSGQVLHMVFKGNPGTGKTTVARMVATLFREVNVLEKGHFIEADRSDLVGEYIGHTAQKTKELIHKALGGVLFIDEAYSLARGGEKDFGKEAIDTLVKCMEDHHDQLIIILAGYPDEMDDFLMINPGLASRFPIQLTFQDYSAKELSQIAFGMIEEREYCLTKEAERKLMQHLLSVCSRRKVNFSNARYVRNLIEEAIRKHACRVIGSANPKKSTLMTLEAEDFRMPVEESFMS
ncbi:AAA family ATPase [Halobacillus karajensis]|uniref:Stage V sporulation protein K n=1 Tax=Halobacillus karajensis TaxID=195088 RepID=A0A024P1E5_9BACI|nr:AAA family ATPase [Halobacillus karajensis]CDQ19659.1 Stage V sporulation protein K [Halobacillus karajensis]CDQ22119.1 Stage V sporulation protein K [Halobacillus karajensis]CDQ27960.1 Stage V sporulation protein K [Halobacillus karajensis]